MVHDDIETRLAALEARAPDGGDPPQLPRADRRARIASPAIVAGVLVLVLGSAAAGGALVGMLAQGVPGIQNPGQPLHGARLECLSPPQAAAYLQKHGFMDVVWQVETGEQGGKSETSVQRSSPPEHGYVVPGAILRDGRLHMVVDQRKGATGTGACPDMRMP